MNIPYTRRNRVAFSRNATSTTKCRTPSCFSRFYPAYLRDRYRSRTGKDSEDEIGCGFLGWKLGALYRSRAGVLIFVVAPQSSATGNANKLRLF